MPPKNPNNPEKDFTRQIKQLVLGGLSKERPVRAYEYIEEGSWNWMGLSRVIVLWWAWFYGTPKERETAQESLCNWFERQEKQGHMFNEMATASHYELYFTIVGGARILGLRTNNKRLTELTTRWIIRQEALVKLGWIVEDGVGHFLFPHARAGHGGVSQAAAVVHQLIQGLPLNKPATKPAFWNHEDMAGVDFFRRLVNQKDDFAIKEDNNVVPKSVVSAKNVTIDLLPQNVPLLLNEVTYEKYENGDLRIYATKWNGGGDPALWVLFENGKKRIHGDGEPKPNPIDVVPVLLNNRIPDTVIEIGPNGWRMQRSDGGTLPTLPIEDIKPPKEDVNDQRVNAIRAWIKATEALLNEIKSYFKSDV